jgi:hypothetical protein
VSLDPRELKDLRKLANTIAEPFGAAADIESLDLMPADLPGGVRLRVSVVRCTARGNLTDVQEFWVPFRMVRETIEERVGASAAHLAAR